ncbi:tyrosine-type recombinase/integrase [Bacillus sp. MUM 13]|uniref:tyrosine-type recombinase/integrase n=1 Tax=Bacillus sp. MUM 13 TaxID=1678001 RepID=UPI0008F5AC45|nr:tyrosine-type recombinase/integrase [Bacillus sp. MUM 13]OIK10071.1 hypothetical protein BIV59_15155 [Bacillus sp. MUM 13]
MYFSQNFNLPFYVTKFIKFLKRTNKSEETIKGYSTDLKLFNTFIYQEYEGNILLEQLTRNDLLDYLDHLQRERGYKLNSVSRHLSTLKSLYKFLVDEMNFKDNVAARIKHTKAYVPLPTILEPHEVSHLLSVAKKHNYYYFILFSLIYFTGSRITPITQLEKSNVFINEKKLYFPVIKGGEDLHLPIHDELVPTLKQFLLNHPAPLSKYVFHSPRSYIKPIDPQTVRGQLKEIVKKAKIEKRVTPHILRHCTATHLTILGVDQKYIASILGHKDLRSTARYQQLHVDNLRSSINRLS